MAHASFENTIVAGKQAKFCGAAILVWTAAVELTKGKGGSLVMQICLLKLLICY